MDLLRVALRFDDLPVVIGRVNDSHHGPDNGPTQPWIGLVRAGQAAFVENEACATDVTETRDSAFSEDGWHDVSADYVRMREDFTHARPPLSARCGPRYS
jgi:hypothetical protein